ncbi:MAG: hypothetical protein ACK48K_17145, partial [Planctomycetota bacterium]
MKRSANLHRDIINHQSTFFILPCQTHDRATHQALEVARFDEVHIDRLGTFRGPVSMSCVGEVITR